MDGANKNKRNLIVFGIIFYLTLTFISLNYYSGILPAGLFLVGFLFVFGLILFFIFRYFFVRKIYSKYFIVLALASLLAVISDSIINRVKLKSTQEMADHLIFNIEQYNIEYGEYPTTLKDLVKKSLIDKIPTTSFPNSQFYYETENCEKGYILSYYVPLGMEATYESVKGEWDYDD